MPEARIEFPGNIGLRSRAWVLPKRDGPWVVVRRVRADGSLDWFTWHFTRIGARRAARLWERTGKTRGFRP